MRSEDVETTAARAGATAGADPGGPPGAPGAPGATAGADHGGPPDGTGIPVLPARRGPSMRPALLVVGIAAGLIVVFGVLAVVAGHGTGGSGAPSRPARVRGTSLVAVAAVGTLAPIEHPGTPPADIVDSLTLPRAAAVRGHRDNNASVTQYDEQMEFSVHAPQGSVVDFYKVELKARGWDVFSVGPANGTPGRVEVLAQKGGSDGWYWEVGAVVSPTRFAGRGTGGESTAFTLRLFQEPDDD